MRSLRRAIRAPIGALALAGLLGGCQTAGPQVVARDVKIPVAVSCAADPGPDPAYVDTPSALGSAADLFERVKLLLAGRDQRIEREGELKAALSGCATLPKPPP
ncbi:MAG TPA: hypothetical protein VGS12_12810 [Caulobacteraceae bacterium]|nr:hypothetical protein [Caulobacteraceae bacterium]